MAKQSINIGSSANDKTGDPLRTAFNKINENFTELYGASPFGQQVTISGNQISANESNADLVLSGSGTGGVVASAVRRRSRRMRGGAEWTQVENEMKCFDEDEDAIVDDSKCQGEKPELSTGGARRRRCCSGPHTRC